MSFGEQIRLRRSELRLTRAELAERLGVSPSAVSNYENGLSFPKEDVMLRLFDCLETEPNVLFRDSYREGGRSLSASEQALLRQYRGLSLKGRETVRSVVDALCAYRDEVEETGPDGQTIKEQKSLFTATRRRQAMPPRCSARTSTISPLRRTFRRRRSSPFESAVTPWPLILPMAAWSM